MKFLVTQYVLFTATILTNYNYNYLKEAITMKKAILTVASLAVFLSAGSMVSAAAPATEKHEQKCINIRFMQNMNTRCMPRASMRKYTSYMRVKLLLPKS